jgi:hypothetical protein
VSPFIAEPDLAVIALRMGCAMALVVAASVLVERYGPLIGALIATLPLAAGPAYVFIALDHDAAFVGKSALATLQANAATAVFGSFYALSAVRFGLVGALAIAYAGWSAVVFALVGSDVGLGIAIVANIAAFGIGIVATRSVRSTARPVRRPRRWWEIPLRATGVMLLVAAVIIVAGRFGPAAAGVAAAFPIIASSMILILHSTVGGAVSAATQAYGVPAMAGFGVAALSLHLTAPTLGSAVALGISLAICMLWNAMLASLARIRSSGS